MKNKSKILAYIVTILIVVILSLTGYEISTEQAHEIQNSVEDVVAEEVKEVDNQSTTEIPALTEQDEQNLEEQEVESESFELQGNIAYESGESFDTNGTTGDYAGLTYYSQIDSRWANIMYSSTGNSSQTIGTSGCGPTSSAMIVSSIKGTVTPAEMADDFVAHGYRSANNGTYWSAYRYVADKYNIGYTESSSIDRAVDLIRNQNYMCAVSVGNGLFTTGRTFCSNLRN